MVNHINGNMVKWLSILMVNHLNGKMYKWFSVLMVIW